jgi:glycosyltransferase involved in cell wall biosynthesis
MVREAELRPLRVLALVPYALGTAPSQRYRLEQWAPSLAGRGITLAFAPFADPELTALLQEPGRTLRKAYLIAAALVRRSRELLSLPEHEAVVVHRSACLAGPPWVEKHIRSRGRALVYDFDDAIFRLHSAAANQPFTWLKAPGKTATLCRMADHVVVGNEFLAAYARDANDRVSIVPSSIDTERCRPLSRPPNDRLVVGWMGSSTSQTHLEAAAPTLRAILAARAVELRVVSNRRPTLPGVDHTWRPWSAETEARELAGFDIGIMPMPDDDWARGKCALKALQYMAMGVSTVASAVGTNRDVIEHGRNGLLAVTAPEWVECISRLADNAGLRREIGVAGRRTVEDRYSMTKSAEKFERVLRAVVDRRRETA